jgi:hypothetical protein
LTNVAEVQRLQVSLGRQIASRGHFGAELHYC